MQAALVEQVPAGTIELQKCLTSLEDLGEKGVELSFEDGTRTEVNLVVGGDGTRSVVRQYIFPGYTTKFIGLATIPCREIFKYMSDAE